MTSTSLGMSVISSTADCPWGCLTKLPLLFVEYRALYPNIDPHIVEHRTPPSGRCRALRDRRALIRLPHDKTKLSITVLRDEALVAALPKSHPLAGEATVEAEAVCERAGLISNRSEPFHLFGY